MEKNKGLVTAASRFLKDRNGNFAVLTGVTVSMLAMAVGFGVNLAQAYHVKTTLRSALDAAVTSTARDLTTGKVAEDGARALVDAFLQANNRGTFAKNDEFRLGDIVINRTDRTIEATASANVDIAFPLFSNQNPVVAVTSAAVYSDKKIEVAMMLDVTGSMAGQKIKDLKAAATNAVNMVLAGQNPDNPRTRVAIIPYSQSVNTGALAPAAVYDETTRDGADLPAPIDAAIAAGVTGRVDNCSTERKLSDGSPDYSDDSPYAERRNRDGKIYIARVNRDDRVTICPQARVVPLTADAAALRRSIDQFSAAGVTAGGVGVQWASYMLSPKWRRVIRDTRLGNGPEDYNPQLISKVAILMTDGLFNTSFAGIRGTTTTDDRRTSEPGTKARANAEAICKRMKDDGIDVYTIGFALDDPAMSATETRQAKAVLRACASPDANNIRHYFEASTGPELDAAFKEIIRNAERLALTK